MTDPTPFLALIYALAAWRATRFFLYDELFSGPRDKIWEKYPPESTKIGYLFTCPWCLGLYISVFFTLILLFGGTIGLIVALILAFSAFVGILQTLLDR